MFNKIIFSLLFIGFGFITSLKAQSIFNDTILFKITDIRTVGNDFRYLIEFETADPNAVKIKTGTIVMKMCNCYCDSIWDAWPVEVGGLTGGAATVDYISSSSGGGGLGSGLPQRQRGRLNIWQMPGSFSLTEAFQLPVILRFDP